MSNLESHNPKLTEETTSGASAQNQGWAKFIRWLDAFLDRLYRNRWEANPPTGIAGQVWGMPSIALPFPWVSHPPTGNIQPGEFYFLHYFQSQGYGPTPNECVTTAALMSMNMLKDWMAVRQGHLPEPDRELEEYTRELDTLGLRGWRYRFSTQSPLPGMMTPWQAVTALKDFSAGLGKKYGKTYKLKLSARHKLLDLIEQLREGHIILIHGAWQMTLDRNNKNLRYNPLLAFLGGMPHTMLLIGYDGDTSQWLLLNPADPWPADKHTPVTPKIYKMNASQLMDFWGRKFLFYPPRFAFTTIMLED